jgi:glucokinase
MPFVVFSGLPGSGKSTLARRLAPELGLPVLDKDDFLDALFDERGIGDLAWRAALSRAADVRFAAAAQALGGACLVSCWRHPASAATESGTPTEWLSALQGPLVEVYCRCGAETAIRRFLARERHPGHLDVRRTPSALRDRLRRAVAAPLACGPLISVDTEEAVAIAALVDRLRDALGSSPGYPGSGA